MAARPISHPSPQVLRALAADRLDEAAARAVLAHLEVCPECCLEVTTLGGDGVLRRLRAAETATSGGTVGPGAAGAPEDVPPELRGHAEFEVLGKLGGGGMGVVYLTRDRLTHRQEVLKVVNPYLATQPGVAERFLREIRAVVQLLHPNIVTAYGALQIGGLLVLKMEYVPGEDLNTVVKNRGSLPVVNACYYAQQVAAGLQYAFGKGMVHRDIKPGNLMLVRDGKKHVVKILDFGLVKAIAAEGGERDQLTRQAQGMGTPAYMAPEQAKDAARADTRADVYGLGCTLYFLLTGRPPFSGTSPYDLWEAHRSQAPVPLSEVRQDVPAELAAVVAKMLAKDPARRYQEPAEVAQALKPFLKAASKPPTAPLSEGPKPKAADPTPSADKAGETGSTRPVATPAEPGDGRRVKGQPAVSRREPPVGGKSKKGLIAVAVGVAAIVVTLGLALVLMNNRRTAEPTAREEVKKPEPEESPFVLELANEPGSEMWADALREPWNFPGFDDPDTNIEEALTFLRKGVGEKSGRRFSFTANQQAIQADLGVEDVLRRPLGKEMPARPAATRQEVLELITARVHANVRHRLTRDGVEITSVFELPVSTRGPVKGLPFRQLLDSIEDQFHISIDSSAVKNSESVLVSLPATSNVRLRVILERVLRQADAIILYPAEDTISVMPSSGLVPGAGLGGLMGAAGAGGLGGLGGGVGGLAGVSGNNGAGGKVGFNGGQGQ